MSLEISASLAAKIGFASHQNAVPLLHELLLVHSAEQPLENLAVVLSADPGFLEKKIWRIDRIDAELRLPDRELKLDAGFLADLTEGLRGEIRIEVRQDDAEGAVLAKESYPVELLAKNHWGGTGSMPELLPAFCMPNDPAVDKVLKAASDVLRRAGKPAGIDGYEGRSRTRTWELTSAIWSAVSGLELSYALPPASFEVGGQKVRTPGAILEGRMATCLDTSMLFAAALEQASLNPLIILTQGHAFVGVWLQPQEFSLLTTDEAMAVRKRVELQEILVFETTLVTHSPVPSFSKAVDEAVRKLNDDEFHMAIDIRRARMRRIKPLGFASAIGWNGATDAVPPPAEALEEAPALPGFDVEVATEAESADDRVTQWQRKLLDLTARNRLLHLPQSSKHVPLTCPDPGALEDLLAAGRTLTISPLPGLEDGGRDAALYRELNREDLIQKYAEDALASGEVLSPLTAKKLESELIDLYRKANTDIAEGGANTLFLALGFLNWKKSAEDPRTYRAPLILLPVTLKRQSALSGVKMTAHEDEPRFNLTLLELLRQDFDLHIPGLDGDLPEDASGIDVVGIWNRVRKAVKEIPGFEVTTDTAIGTFSFSKYLMWKDLMDRRDQLMENPVVKHLIERGQEGFAGESSFPREDQLDETVDPAGLFTPLPADSSQLAAVVASGRGHNFVLDGPPGTGKSQTIANMIVHNLSMGRRVLFVAEKMAALEVVYRRLEERGLGDFCLEVHSHKTSKMEILTQLDRAWSVRGELSQAEWDSQTGRLKSLRDRLNLVSHYLHRKHANGITVHEAIGRVARDHHPGIPRLSWNPSIDHDEETYQNMRATAHRLDLNHDAYTNAPHGFSNLGQSEWSNVWQESVISVARSLPRLIENLGAAREKLIESCKFDLSAGDEAGLERIFRLVRSILSTRGKLLEFAFAPDLQAKLDGAQKFIGLLKEYQKVEGQLSVRYPEEAARKVDPDQLDSNWAEAGKKVWILGKLAKRKVAKKLAAQCGSEVPNDLPGDSARLREMKALLGTMDELRGLLEDIPGYSFLHSKPGEMEVAIEIADGIQRSLSQLAKDPEQWVSLKAATRRLVVDANLLLEPGGTIGLAFDACGTALEEYRKEKDRFADLCGIGQAGELAFDEIKTASESVTGHESRLRSWCAWQRVKREALDLGLKPLIDGVEDGSLPKGEVENAFLTGYSKWFAAQAIDQEPVLRDFVAAEHMDCVEDFRKLDEEVARMTIEYTRTALASRLPEKDSVGRKDGYGILKHELQKKRRHKPLRQLATEMGSAFGGLAPCMLMSPLSIAQYLPADQDLFDLVIFDEASQIAPWDAVGSIARGKQVVIAGDPRQMPPTNFFQRAEADAEFDGNVDGDLESILDECLAVGIPRHCLSWHYRSRHESLIAFSNHAYYGGGLITFPAAETKESAVTWRRINGVYSKLRARTNQDEAEAIVGEVVSRLLDPEFNRHGWTLGIITLNADQQKLIEDLLDDSRRKHPEIEPHFNKSLSEPVVVKNLETVQGDERDVILLGIGYGPKEPGAHTMSMNFGPLNRDGGERRLNVAVTRSRREMVVFTSFDPSMIDLNRTGARAVRDLKHFLEFAERGPRALTEAVKGSMGGYDSPFEEAVAKRLQDLGWEVVSQVGVSRFRIDLGIVHPRRPGDFLVGVECDGATYHSAATARDRDKVRAAVLEGLGWKLLRVWSTDWFIDPESELKRLDEAIRGLLEAEVEAPTIDPDDEPMPAGDEIALVANQQGFAVSPEAPPAEMLEVAEAVTGLQPGGKATSYQEADFAEFMEAISPARFHDDAYDLTLIKLIRHTLECEAPVADDLLVTRIARVHDFKRSGRLIRERVLRLVEEHFHLRADPVDGSFVWLEAPPNDFPIVVREPSGKGEGRRIEQVPSEEIAAAHLIVDGDDHGREVARLFGILRLSAAGRERIESAVGWGLAGKTEARVAD